MWCLAMHSTVVGHVHRSAVVGHKRCADWPSAVWNWAINADLAVVFGHLRRERALAVVKRRAVTDDRFDNLVAERQLLFEVRVLAEPFPCACTFVMIFIRSFALCSSVLRRRLTCTKPHQYTSIHMLKQSVHLSIYTCTETKT